MVALVAALTKPSLRESFADVLRAGANRHIASFIVFLALWTGGAAYLLRSVGLWSMAHMKETAIWFVSVATVTGLQALTSYANPRYRRAVLDGLKLTVLVEFLVALAPFHLAVELVLVPILAILGLMAGLAGTRAEWSSVKKLLDGLLGVAGLVIVLAAGWQTMAAVGQLDGPSLLRSFLLPPLLSALLIPAIFLLVVQARFEWLFGKIRGPWHYRLYARIRLAVKLGPAPQTVMDFGRRYAFDLPHVRTGRALEAMLRNPPSRSVDVEALRAMSERRANS